MGLGKRVNLDVETILGRERIKELYDRMLEKYPKARYCMITVMDEEGGCFTDNAGAVSYLEYRGLGAYLHDLCDRCAADLAEQEDDDDEGEDNKP